MQVLEIKEKSKTFQQAWERLTRSSEALDLNQCWQKTQICPVLDTANFSTLRRRPFSWGGLKVRRYKPCLTV